ncbi:NADH-quinone oxidoreductase subunit K [Streptococcus suis]|nr:NADH-quinone oxidoreductase subunit K [Streptococcus suis]
MATKDEWVGLFERVVGRQPSQEECLAGQMSNFNPTQIIRIAGFEQRKAAKKSSLVTSEKATRIPKATVKNRVVSSMSLELILSSVSLAVSLGLLVGLWLAPVTVIILILSAFNVIVMLGLCFLNLRQSKQFSSVTALILASLVLVFPIGVAVFQQNHLKEVNFRDSRLSPAASQDDTSLSDTTDVNAYIDKKASFNWTENQFSALVFSGHHQGGTSLQEVLKSHGKANQAEMSGEDLTLTYESGEGSHRKEVRLRFEKQVDGQFTLVNGSAYGISETVPINRDYHSNWTSDDVAALVEGDSETGKGGSQWRVIQEKHGAPKDAFTHLSNFGDGVLKILSVTYSDYEAKSPQLGYVSLDFVFNDGDYYLIHKYSDDDND